MEKSTMRVKYGYGKSSTYVTIIRDDWSIVVNKHIKGTVTNQIEQIVSMIVEHSPDNVFIIDKEFDKAFKEYYQLDIDIACFYVFKDGNVMYF